jgi:hypothetical protein
MSRRRMPREPFSLRAAALFVGAGLVWLALGSPRIAAPPVPQPLQSGGTPGKPPTNVPWPIGWRRYKGSTNSAMINAAVSAVSNREAQLGDLIPGGELPDGSGQWAVFLEWHYHPPGQGFAADGWHKGATLVWR